MIVPDSSSSQKREGRELLLAVARDAFLQGGYANVSMQQIAEAAGMTKGAPYYHFKNKDELFLSVFVGEIHRIELALVSFMDTPGPIRGRLIAATQSMLENSRGDLNRLISDYEFHIREKSPNSGIERLGDDVEKRLTPYFAAARAQGEFGRVDADVAVSFFLMLLFAQIRTHQLKPRPGVTKDLPLHLAQNLVDFLFEGIR